MDDYVPQNPELAAAFGAPPPEAENPLFDNPELNAVGVRAGRFTDPRTLTQAALSARMPVEDVADHLPPQLHEPYRNELRLEQERDRFKGAQESTQGFITRRVAPFVSAVHNVREEQAYADAVKRFREGKPEEGDYAKIAGYERLQQIEKERSTGESVGAAVAHVPAILGEGVVAGKMLGAAGRAISGAGKVAAPVAGEAVGAATEASRLARVGGFGARVAATTPLMPSMYLAEAGKRAAQNGGDWRDSRNFAPAFGMGMAQVAVLGSLQKFVTEGSFLRKVAGKTALGMGEQQAVDASAQALSDAVLEKAWKVETGYGLAGDVFRAAQGRENGAVKHALSQAAVFGIFSAMHSFKGNRDAAVERGSEIPSDLAAEIAKMKAAGFDKLADQKAAEFGATLEDLAANTQRWESGPTKEAAAEALKDVPEEFKPVAKKVIDSLPTLEEVAKKAGTTPERLSAAMARGGRDPAVERLIREQGPPVEPPKPETPAPEAEPAVPDAPVPIDHLAVLGEAGLREFSKRSGWALSNPDSILKRAAASVSDTARLDAFARKRLSPSPEPSEKPTPPETAQEGPRTADRPQEPQPPPEGAVRPAETTGEGKSSSAIRREALRRRLTDLSETPPPADPRTKILGGVIEAAGLKDRAVDAGGKEFYRRLEFGDREMTLNLDPDSATLSIGYSDRAGGSLTDIPKEVRGGTVTLLRAVRSVAEAARKSGLSIEYRAEQKRHELYAKVLSQSGYELKSSEPSRFDPVFVAHTWTPTAEAKAGRKAAGLKPEEHPTLEVPKAETREEKLARIRANPPKPPAPDPAARTGRTLPPTPEAKAPEPFKAPPDKPIAPDPAAVVAQAAREMAAEGTLPEAARGPLQEALAGPLADSLDAQQRYVLEGRLLGKTFDQIAAEGHADGGLKKKKGVKGYGEPYTRARVEQLEAAGLKALELTKAAVGEDAAAQEADRVHRMAEGDVDVGEMSFAPEEVAAVRRKFTAAERAEAEVRKLSEEYIALSKEAKSRGQRIDPEREAEITRRAEELDEIITGKGAPASRELQKVPGGSRPPAEPSPPAGESGQKGLTREEWVAGRRKARAAEDAKGAEADAKRRAAGLKKAAAGKGAEDTIRKWVVSEGGLHPRDIEGIFGEGWQKEKDYQGLIHLTNKESKAGLDVLGEMAQRRGLIPDDPTRHPSEVLMEALVENRKIGEAASAGVEVAFSEREARDRDEYEQAVREGRIEPTEYTPSDEDIPFSRGNAAPPAAPNIGGAGPTAARLNATVTAEFGRVTGAKDYRAESRLPGGQDARADLRQRATTTTRMADQDPFTTLEEAAHQLAWNKGTDPLPTGAGGVPKAVYDGFAELNAAFGRRYTPDPPPSPPPDWTPPHVPVNVVEGYASWAKLRAAGLDANLTGDAKAAAEWAENWTRSKNLMGPIDAVTPLFTKYHAQDPTQRAQGYGSSTGLPVAAPRTAGEVSADLGRRLLDDIDNNLYPAERFEAEVRKAGGKVDPEKSLSTVMAAARTGSAAARAAVWARDGVQVMLPDGRMRKAGPSVAEIEAGAKPEWLAPGLDGAASKAGAYHTARGVVRMRKDGYRMRDEARQAMEDAVDARDSATGPLREALNKEVARRRAAFDAVLKETEPMVNRVSEEMYADYEAALARWNAEPEFGEWAKGFSARLTESFNAMLDFMESVGQKTKEDVQRWKSMFPDYTPTERVLGADEGWNVQVPGKKGEKAPNLSRQASGSGEAIVDPRLVHQQRLLKFAEVYNRSRVGHAVDLLAAQPGAGPFVQKYNRADGTRTEKGLEKSEELRKAGLSGDQIGRALKDMEVADAEVYFRHEPWPEDGRKATYEYLVDGKLTSVRVGDRSLYELITNQQVDAHQTARLLRAISQMEVLGVKPVQAQAQVVRTLATGASAAFQSKNVPRDTLSFWRNTTDRASVWQLPGEYWKMAGRFAREFSFNLGTKFGKDAARPRAEEDPLWRAFADARGDQLKQFAFERDNPEKSFQGVKTTPNIGSLVKDALNWLGSPELAPRFLEWKNNVERLTGRTQEQLRTEYDAYYKDLKAGRKATAPLTPGQEALLLNAAWEVTSPFPRQGVVTREFNKITPFFGPAVAGVSKAVRNWKTNPKGALYALGLVAGLRALHWALVKDEPWYDQLSANDKFNNFVVPTPWGPRRLPGPRDLDVAFGGTLVSALDAANGKDPRFKQLLEQSTEAVLPPGIGPAAGDAIKGDVGMAAARVGAMPAGPVGTVGVEMMMNRDWTGKPIVPRREEGKTSGVDQFTDHYGPYALKQLTGGRGELSLSGAGLNLVPRVANLRESVDRMYDRIHELEVARVKANRAGTRFPQEAEWDRLQAAKAQVEKLAAQGRGERKVGTRVLAGEKPEAEVKQDIILRQAEVARRALGR